MSGKLAVPCICEEATDFHNGEAKVKIDGQWYTFNNLLIPTASH